MKFCPECGTKRIEEAKFCHECGYKFIFVSKEEVRNEMKEEPVSIEEIQGTENVETEEHNEPNFVLLGSDGKTDEQRRDDHLNVALNHIKSTESYKAMKAADKVMTPTKEFASELAKEKLEEGKEAAKEIVRKAANKVVDHVKKHGTEYAFNAGKFILTKKQ
ncbi:zinc ribbon domain-containing protein [Cytobacillus gottheilii]|uniref:zinc ribbon domain-containing protein n=1 Tax=Cytobacillus gottheilii TaxID=859144 RepID=UPI0009B99B4E|nr:zinc-ribbon domain-containing protein [Cytobacillus gottheilii]